MSRRLYRCRENRVLAGVAAGVAEYFGLDPTLVRILWFVSVFFGGLGIVVYVGLALIVPLEPSPAGTGEEGATVAVEGHRHVGGGSGRVTTVIGSVLILIGVLALIDMVLPGWASWRQLWPLLFIGVGAVLIVGALRREPTSL